MKTLKIPDDLHKSLTILKAEYCLKTIAQTIRFLECYYRQQHKKYEKEN